MNYLHIQRICNQRIIYIFNEELFSFNELFVYSTNELFMYSTDELIIYMFNEQELNLSSGCQNPNIANLVQKFSNWFLGSYRKFCQNNILFY